MLPKLSLIGSKICSGNFSHGSHQGGIPAGMRWGNELESKLKAADFGDNLPNSRESRFELCFTTKQARCRPQ